MGDVNCRVCGEPWEAWGDFSDMKRWEAALFKAGAGCPSCAGHKPKELDADDAHLAHARSVIFTSGHDDPDQFGAVFDGADAPRPAWVAPADTVEWTCAGCGAQVVKYGDPASELPEDARGWKNTATHDKFYSDAYRKRVYLDEFIDEPETRASLTVDGQEYCPICAEKCAGCGDAVIFTGASKEAGDSYDPGAHFPHPGTGKSICADCFENVPTCEECGEYDPDGECHADDDDDDDDDDDANDADDADDDE